MSAKFQPIKVTNLISEKTKQSPTASGLRLIHWELSDSPSREWIQLFDNQRRMPRGRNMLGGREANVRGNCVVIDCTPEEIEKQHEYLLHDVEVANADYQQHLNRVQAQIERQNAERQAELEKIEGIKSRLNF